MVKHEAVISISAELVGAENCCIGVMEFDYNNKIVSVPMPPVDTSIPVADNPKDFVDTASQTIEEADEILKSKSWERTSEWKEYRGKYRDIYMLISRVKFSPSEGD